jgi:CheY-like chemotaxis protein
MNMQPDTAQTTTLRGVLLTSNLLFSSMVTGTAAAIGKEVVVAGDLAEALQLCRAGATACVIIDLGMAELDIAAAVVQIREAAGPVPFIAYGSHVDKARLDEARAAGFSEVMPRSKFSAELPQLLGKYLNVNDQQP